MIRGKDYIGVGVGAMIINQDQKMFLSLRGKEVRNESGTWEFPGGGVNFNEALVEAITREIKEEYDFEIQVMELLQVADHIIREEKQHWVSPTFLCKVVSGEPKIMEPEKCAAIGWYDIDEMKKITLSIITQSDIQVFNEKYQGEIPNYY